MEKMLAILSRVQAGGDAGQQQIENVPCIICMPVAVMSVSAVVKIVIPETDANTSVFLCALQHLVALLLLGCMALLSLTLTGLTGLSELKSLVGLSMERAINTA